MVIATNICKEIKIYAAEATNVPSNEDANARDAPIKLKNMTQGTAPKIKILANGLSKETSLPHESSSGNTKSSALSVDDALSRIANALGKNLKCFSKNGEHVISPSVARTES